MKQGGVWRMVTAMLLSGTIGLFVLASGQTVATVVFWRCLLGAAGLLGWLFWRGQWQALQRRHLAWLALGGVALILNWFCLFSAYRLSSISIATVLYHMQPFFLLLLAALVQRETPDWHKLPWLVLALGGVALTAGLTPGNLHGAMLGGMLLALAAAFLYALATLATRKLAGVPPAQIAGLQLLLGVLVVAPLADLGADLRAQSAWSSLLLLGLLHTALMYNLMYGAFQRLPAATIATLSFIYPLVALVVDVAYFHTALSMAQLLGMACILVAVVANQRGWRLGPANRRGNMAR